MTETDKNCTPPKNPVAAAALRAQVRAALAEDIGPGDATAALIPEGAWAEADLLCRTDAVVAGRDWFEESFRLLADGISFSWRAEDGDRVAAGTVLCRIEGPARALLTGERTALNFLQTLAAVATRTRRFVDAVAGTGAQILDTRKTLPGLRLAQKYAVTCGGGVNHRLGLHDQILIKENHITACGSITAAVERARTLHPTLKVEVETETLAEVGEAIAAGADIVMVDNFDLGGMRAAVALIADRAQVEASGGVTIDNVRAIAETGVDYISVGSLTKDIEAADLSLRFGP